MISMGLRNRSERKALDAEISAETRWRNAHIKSITAITRVPGAPHSVALHFAP